MCREGVCVFVEGVCVVFLSVCGILSGCGMYVYVAG